MNLDAADLAVLELDIQNLQPLGRDVAQLLIDRIREQEDDVEIAEKALADAKDHAKDAKIALDILRHYLTDAPIEADRKADTIDDLLDDIAELET